MKKISSESREFDEKIIHGLSKLSKNNKIEFVNKFIDHSENPNPSEFLKSFWHADSALQNRFDDFSENTISNFYVPYGVVPNFLLNGKIYCVPMAIEESSVIAAASKSAKFWLKRGGFKAKVLSTQKNGQVHFTWNVDPKLAQEFFESVKIDLLDSLEDLTQNMKKRGGGISSLVFKDMSSFEDHYFQLFATFETCDAMGANFINSVLEAIAEKFEQFVDESLTLPADKKDIVIIMSILSNYTPNCLVEALVSCPIRELENVSENMSAKTFIRKISQAVNISRFDTYRAVTHNKGILNGVDGLVLATGNDFRATEASCHAYAARDGQYRGLSQVKVIGDEFIFSIKLPLAIGVVGGLTSLHPLAKFSLNLLGSPRADELMMLASSLGLAQNFGALSSLVTSGIQKGHMKMHLLNILTHLKADKKEHSLACEYFKDKVISFSAVGLFLQRHRDYH